MVILFLYKGSWWGTPHWGLQSSPNIHEHTYQKKDIVIDTKIVEIRKPQAELAETMCLCWHLLRLLRHRHMVTPPRAFVKFRTLPNYLSVTNLTYLIRLGRLSSHVFTVQRSTGPIQNEQSLFCAVSEACEVVWIDISTKTFDKTSSLLVSPPWLSPRRKPFSVIGKSSLIFV